MTLAAGGSARVGRPGDQGRGRAPGRRPRRGRGAVRQPADPARALGPDGRPAVSRRAPIWEDVPDEKWNDWRWQLSHRVNDLEEIEQILEPDRRGARRACPRPTSSGSTSRPYFISLIDPDDPNDPIRRQVIPLGREQQAFTAMMEDSLAEDRHSPVPGPRPSLPRPRPDARHDPVRRATAATARGRGSSATRPRTSTAATTRRSSSTCAGRRRSATSSSPAATA